MSKKNDLVLLKEASLINPVSYQKFNYNSAINTVRVGLYGVEEIVLLPSFIRVHTANFCFHVPISNVRSFLVLEDVMEQDLRVVEKKL